MDNKINRDELLESGEKKLKVWEVMSNITNLNLRTICMEIDNASEGQGGINLKPYYQREYKFTRKDESLLIESLLAGIPIPTIYLASDTTRVPHVSNVIDGQHRLMAVHKFINNKFALTGLEKYYFLNGKKFNDLNPTIQNKLLYQVSLTLQFIHIQDNPELEIEIFTRYNKGTHPLTGQEIMSVVFQSKFNDWVNDTVDKLKKNQLTKDIFNITSKRYSDKTIHGELYVLFSLFKGEINQDFYSSTKYIDLFMQNARKLNENDTYILIDDCSQFLKSLIEFLNIVYYENGLKTPFSKEIYDDNIRFRNHKMQTSIMMIMVTVYKYIKELKIDINNKRNLLREAIKSGFINSGFNEATSSTTRPTLLISTIEYIKYEIDKIS
ncbi:DUF262 domain-containing protein [Clostridium perfringens]|uniref:DUF262 domain-containing protein n=1 Tax=Clostridium perfringens TaxID=1502 RepID=UPI0030D38E43